MIRKAVTPRGRNLMSATSVGEALATRLYAAETAIDSAVRETATLIAMLPSARADLWLSAVTGQSVFEDAAASVHALTEARRHMVSTHNTLAALARRLGIEPLATGPVDKPEDTPPIGGGPEGFGAPGLLPTTAHGQATTA